VWSRLARCFSSASRCRSHGDTLRVESATASATCGVPDKTLESCGSPCETQELPGPCPRGLSVQYSPRQHRTEAAMPEHHSAPTECRTIQLRPARGQRFGAPACPLIPAPPSDPGAPQNQPKPTSGQTKSNRVIKPSCPGNAKPRPKPQLSRPRRRCDVARGQAATQNDKGDGSNAHACKFECHGDWKHAVERTWSPAVCDAIGPLPDAWICSTQPAFDGVKPPYFNPPRRVA